MAMDDHNSEERMSRTIFARNISFHATVEDLKASCDHFSPDRVLDIKLPIDRETGRSRGFGFIEFQTAEDCQHALSNAKAVIHDREIILSQSQPRSQQHGGGRGGRGGFRGGRGGGGYRGGRGGYNNYNNGGGYNNHQGGYGGNAGGFGGNYHNNQGNGGYNRFQGQGQPQGGFHQQQQGGGFQQQPQGGFGGQY